MAISQNFPDVRPSLNLNFANSRTLDPRITFTRSSIGTYVASNGLIKTAAADEPRFDHDPVTGESLGLLIEEERTNLSFYSNSYTSWGLNAVTSPLPTNNTQISPDGTQTAWQFPIGSTGILQRNYGITAGQTYTFSFFAKRGSGTAMGTNSIGVNGNDIFVGTIYNWSTNTLGSGWSKVDYSNGWSRFYRTFTSSTSTLFIQRMDSSYGTGQYIWGAQLEAGSFATSYIPTTASAVTRSPDIASIEGNEFAKTNLLQYSERFDQSTWGKNGSFASSQVPNAALAPDGTQSAEEYQNLSTGNNNVQQSISASAQPYVFSVYLKAKTASDVGKSVLIGGHLNAGTHLREAVQLPAEWTRFTKAGTATAATWNWGVDGRTSGTFTGINVTREESSFYIWGSQLETGSELTKYTPSVESFVSRASTATYVDDATGLIKTTPVNLFRYSQEFTDPTWTQQNIVLTPNVATAPDGTSTASEMLATGVSRHRISQIIAASGDHTVSVFVKSNGTSHVSIKVSGEDIATEFDIVNGTITRSAPNGGLTNPFITSLENGWYRIGGTAPASNNWLFSTSDGTTAYSSTGDVMYTAQAGDAVYLWGAQLEEGTTATDYIPTGATISGAPRFDHDPVTGESLGLLIEEARTNGLTFSSTLDAYGTSSIASKTQNAGIAPDGTNTAVLAETISTGIDSHLRTNTSQAVNTTYTYSFFAKPGTVDYAVVYNIAKNSVGLTWFNVANGTIGTTASGVTPFIKPAGNGWYRVGVTLTTDSTITNNLVDIRWTLEDGVTTPTTGENIYVWGAQLEEGSFPTSYIPTSGSTVTRAADVSTSALGVDSWYNQSEGTVFADVSSAGSAGIVGFNDGGSERYRIGFAGSNNAAIVVVDGGVVQMNGNTPGNSTPYNQYHKLCNAISENNLSFSYNGTLVQDSSLSVPSVSKMTIGSAIGTSDRLNGHIKRLAYYQTRLSDDKLKSITT